MRSSGIARRPDICEAWRESRKDIMAVGDCAKSADQGRLILLLVLRPGDAVLDSQWSQDDLFAARTAPED